MEDSKDIVGAKEQSSDLEANVSHVDHVLPAERILLTEEDVCSQPRGRCGRSLI